MAHRAIKPMISLTALKNGVFVLFALMANLALAAKPEPDPPLDCSALAASATINELAFSGNSTKIEFIEVKIQDSVSAPVDISNWTLSFAVNGKNPTAITLGQGNGTWNTTNRADNDGPDGGNQTEFPASTWLIYPFPSLVAGQGEALLQDENGGVINYFRYFNNNDNFQLWVAPEDCGTVFERSDADGKVIAREPDGEGGWSEPPGDTPTDGETNDPAPTGPDHFGINYADTTASGIACEGVDITITAHDVSHNAIDAQQATVTLSTSTGRGSWSGSGVTDSTTGDGIAELTFAATATFADVQLSYPDLNGADSETFSVSVTDGSSSNTSGGATAGDSLAVTLALAGFRFIDESGGSTSSILPSQIAGQDSGNSEIILQAIRTDTSTGECAAVYGDGDTVNLDLAAEYLNPTTGAGLAVSINGGAINTHDDNSTSGVSGSFTGVNLTFGADSKAALTLNYLDVGQIQLHAKDSVLLPAGVSATLEGASNGFVVRPYQFVLTTVESNDASPKSNPGTTTTTESSNGFLPAATQFRIVVEAQNANGNLTPNYGNEISPEGIALPTVPTLVFPVGTGANAGVLTNISAFTITGTDGEFENTTVSWNEVGTFTVEADVADGDYLGTGGVAAPIASGNIGRFYPASFSLDNTTSNNTLGYGCGGSAYLSEPDIEVKYTLSALNSNGAVVANYDNTELNYVDNGNPTETDNIGQVTYHAENGNDGTDLGSRFALNSSSAWDDGRIVVDNSGSTLAQFNRDSAVDGPFNSLQLSLSVTDSDGATLLASSLNQNPTGTLDCLTESPSTCTTAALGYDITSELFTTLQLHFGRAVMDSVHGPESASLATSFGTEYWDGFQFLANTDDNCTAIPYSQVQFNSTVITGSPQSVTFTSGTTQGSFLNEGSNVTAMGGSFGLIFSAPGADNTGSFPVDIDLINHEWLRFDWNMDGDNENDLSLPQATISFGSYRGHDRVIYWRERFD